MGVPNGSLPSLVCVRQILSGNSSGIVPCRVYVSVGACELCLRFLGEIRSTGMCTQASRYTSLPVCIPYSSLIRFCSCVSSWFRYSLPQEMDEKYGEQIFMLQVSMVWVWVCA